MSEPMGLHCPGCGHPPALAFAEQAFCDTENCRVMCWNPTKTRDQFLEDFQAIEIPGWLGDRGGGE